MPISSMLRNSIWDVNGVTQETFSPVAQACIRIYRKQQTILVFEDFLLSEMCLRDSS